MSILSLVFVAQILVMVSGMTLFLITPTDFQSLAALVVLIGVGLLASLFAVWRFVADPTQRKLASAVLVTPWVCLGSPFLIVGINGGPIHPLVIAIVGLASMAIIVWLVLWRSTHWQPGGVFTNLRFNLGLGAALFVLLTLYWAPIVGGLYAQDSLTLPRDVAERDKILLGAAIYFTAVAGPALQLSCFALFYASVGMLRSTGRRLLHGGQFLLALVTMASLTLGAIVVVIAMVNPG